MTYLFIVLVSNKLFMIILLLISLQSIFHLAAMQFCEVKSVYSSYGKFNVLTSTGIISQSTRCTAFLSQLSI